MPQRRFETSRSPRPLRRRGAVLVLGFAVAAGLGACGRSAPIDALPEGDGDPDIAGVSVTSPDAVVETEPTTEAEQRDLETTITEEATPEPSASSTYVVQSGDTLSGIATTFGITVAELADANALADVNSITPGDVLAIPEKPVEVSVVDTGETTTPTTTPDSTTQP